VSSSSASSTGVIKGVIRGYRRGPNAQYCNQLLIRVFADPKDLGKLIGAKVVTRDSHGNTYRGRIIRVHSFRNSVVVAKFKPNVPGQLIGHYVEILVSRDPSQQ